MNKIMFILFTNLLLVSSCSTTKILTIRNNTNDTIHFNGFFASKSYEPFNLKFKVKPNGVDSWQYNVGSYEENTVDKKLRKIVLKNEKNCTVELDRTQIEKIAIRNGMWEIIIDKNIMNCK